MNLATITSTRSIYSRPTRTLNLKRELSIDEKKKTHKKLTISLSWLVASPLARIYAR